MVRVSFDATIERFSVAFESRGLLIAAMPTEMPIPAQAAKKHAAIEADIGKPDRTDEANDLGKLGLG